MKTSELTGSALDWAVAEALGGKIPQGTGTLPNQWAWYEKFAPSTNWSHGGPIIERERLQVLPIWREPSEGWAACVYDRIFEDDGTECYQCGPTPLIAAMRCFVASRLGDEVEIPAELS